MFDLSGLTHSYGLTLAIVCPLIFLAGFIDSIAGGGGLISVPAFFFTGIDPLAAFGCNKWTMSLGTATAVVNYGRKKKIVLSVALAGILGALPGSWLGTELQSLVPKSVFPVILMVALPLLVVFMLVNERKSLHKGQLASPVERAPLKERQKCLMGFLVGLIVGWYDGFFGPGAGMFYTLAMANLVRLDLVKAAGTTKAVNLASGVSSGITALVKGNVIFPLIIPAMACAVLGNFIGSRLAIKIGAKFIRPVILLVIVLLFVKIIADWL
jgi:uncharacterized membrane protein YfcA